ncbi:hypothetical protein CC80DRAFT_553584 [Byssothecium circinans]|uniref:Uncharacterized protein n=1 Tax=Byssothecium circinans TaxID=147558 RepID=A0A6A5TEG5_9PLEO|nr:hypothetical protein CC80DRAFT_553584 [Byssothecium circinans]
MSTSRFSRSPVTILLILLGSLAIIYQLFATFPSLATTLYGSLPTSSPSSCTKDIGGGRCCALFLDAEPCVEECRRGFVDRETFFLTEGFEGCADECLVEYAGSCEGEGVGVEGLGNGGI